MRRHPLFLALVLASALVRLAALPLPGTEDVPAWKHWAYSGSKDILGVYGIGGDPPVRGLMQWGELFTTTDYPPVAMYEMALVGVVYRAIWPDFPDAWPLTVAVKLPGLCAGALLTLSLFVAVRRLTGRDDAARWAALAYWANPATIVNGEVLGYLDPLVMLPATGAFLLASGGHPALAGASLGLALLTKPQALLVGPAFVWLVWSTSRGRGLARAAAGGMAAIVAGVLPYALAGALPNMWLAFGSWSARRDILSGYAANLWWIVTWLARAYDSIDAYGFPGAFLRPVRRILAITNFTALGLPHPRPYGTAFVAIALGTSFWLARRTRDPGVLAGLAAFTVHTFFTLAVSVHEHHLMLAVPLLAIAGALRPAFRPVLVGASAVCALNMNLFYGISAGWGWAIPRDLTPIDASVLLAFANVGLYVWHGRALVAEAREPIDPPVAVTMKG
jgi:hypothetical protein